MERRRFLSSLAAVGAGTAAASATPGLAGRAAADPGGGPWAARVHVETGFETLAASGYATLRGQRVGIVTNPTAVTRDLRHEVDVMADSSQVDLVAVFGPEHGFRGTAQAGGSEGSFTDERTGLPVYDTYGKSADELAGFFAEAGVDTVAFDIQDVGARFYTYIWTMYDCMVGAAKAGKAFCVLDRPNPIGGREATGPVMTPEYATFVGRREICQAHGMTVGELASLFAAEFLPEVTDEKIDLTVAELRGWSRDLTIGDTDVPWVMPSPNMPTPDTALVYPGTCMVEGTLASEGRGTTRPFELVGAPWADHRWAGALRDLDLPGVQVREAYFTPTFSKHSGTSCAGVQLHVADPRAFDPVRTGVELLVAAKQLYGDFAWRHDSWDTERPYWVDKLTGSTRLRTMIDDGASADEVVAAWQPELREFRRMRAEHLRYHRDRAGGRG
jgi:uncharacterized protein YbbC (DUF1343 family)